jgi:thiol-disulfide isomerase/thioredoxin
MSEIEPHQASRSEATSLTAQMQYGHKIIGRGLSAAIIGAALVGLLAVLYVIVLAVAKPGSEQGLQSLAKGPMTRLQIISDPIRYPATPFVDAEGRTVHLSAFKGKVLIVNFWATWCAPCVKEMPTLAALQAAYAGRPVKVVAISLDQSAQSDTAKAFIAKHPPLSFYQDAKYGFMSDLSPRLQGFPTTVIFDKTGAERAVMAGEADWASPEAKAVVDRLMGE